VIFIGTSGWQYRSWKDRFYPPGTPQRAWLSHYVMRFPTVEVNNSFYMLPKEHTFDAWRRAAPGGFRYAVKASRYITHIRRMRQVKDAVDLFWSRAARLEDRLGPVLFQFPPNLAADVRLLEDFLSVLPKRMEPAFEFREESWWRDPVYEALDREGAAWVLADRPGWRVPLVVTGGWAYIRFHQGRRMAPRYTRRKLRTWAERIAGLDANETWVFFNNDPEAAAPADAVSLAGILRDLGQDVVPPPGEAGAESGARTA
jgi:uncharacterized protein YecE (DUF72 family)